MPIRVIRRWPAIIFAANRIAKVPGRIMFLMVSMHTINGIKMLGVPTGTMCSNIWLVLLIHPNRLNLSHNGRANASVIEIWLVEVKTYVNIPIVLFIMVNINSEIKINVPPLFNWLSILNSLLRE